MAPPAAPHSSAPRAAMHSMLREFGVALPAEAERHFATRLAVECDPADLHTDLDRRVAGVVLLDVRAADAFAECHIPGALNLPYRRITAETTALWPRETLLVVYCSGATCNASTKACLRLSALGFQVKELVGGLAGWRREGFPVGGSLGANAPGEA